MDVRMARRHNIPFLPAEPFRAWVNSLIDHERRAYYWTSSFQPGAVLLSPEARIAERLEMPTRQIRRYRDRRTEWIREDTVDRACSHEGSVHIADLYPQYWAIAEAGGSVKLRAVVSRSKVSA